MSQTNKAPLVIEPTYFSNWGDIWYPKLANMLFLPVAKRISWLTPNMVSLLSFCMYACAVVGLSVIPTAWILLAAFLPISYILDCLDGQLARTTGKSSVIGDYLDKTLDVLKIGTINTAFAYYAYNQTGKSYYFILGLMSCFGFLFRYYIKLETMFSAINRNKDYLDESRVERKKLYAAYDKRKAERTSAYDYISWFFVRNRSMFALDEAEHVTFGALAIATGNVEAWLWVFGIGQFTIALFRLLQRGYQLKNNPDALLHPMRK